MCTRSDSGFSLDFNFTYYSTSCLVLGFSAINISTIVTTTAAIDIVMTEINLRLKFVPEFSQVCGQI